MKIWTGVVAAIVGLAGQALAAPPADCYRADEIEAVMAVKFMTELMVFNDTCGEHVYEGFIKHNFTTLSTYHQQWVDHFSTQGKKRAEDTVDREVTHIANVTALSVSGAGKAFLCDGKATYFAAAQTISDAGFREVVKQLATQQKDYRLCTAKLP